MKLLDPRRVRIHVRLEVVKDLETLRTAALLLEAENKKLVAKTIELQRQLAEARGLEPKQLELEIAELQRQLEQRNRRIFGALSERRNRREKTQDKKPQTGHGPKPQPNLRAIESVELLTEVQKTEPCEHCGKHIEEWPGQFEESEEIDVVRREFVIKKIKRQKGCCECHRTIVTAPAPPKLFPSARYSIEFAIMVVVAKYLDHLPLERQVTQMHREGLDTDSQTLWDYVAALSRLLRPAHEQLLNYILKKPVIGADETWWRLLGAKGKKQGGQSKKWQVWAACADDAVCYLLEDTRGTPAAEKLLKDYAGIVMADGYGVYMSLANRHDTKFTLVHCWSHVRRKFFEIEKDSDEAREVLDLIDELFAIDRRCPTGPPGDALRAKLRNEESRPIVEKIRDWSTRLRALPGSNLFEATRYMIGMWSGLVRFLDDPRIPLTNNHTERALRGPVVGRKNHYGSRSRRGTEAAAILYSLCESAKLAGVEPHAYLRHAVLAALADKRIPLPHELAEPLAVA